MELQMQMMMDPGSGSLNGGGSSMWLGHSPGSSPQSQPPPPPPYHRLSPNRQDERASGGIIVSSQQELDDESSMKLRLYQASMGFHESTCHSVLWHEKRDSPRHSPDGNLGHLRSNNRDESSGTKHSSASFHQSNGMKRRATGESHQQMSELLERKHARRDGSVGSNGSSGHGGWSTQVEELAEHLAADFDGPLSALAASDLANAVASYNMSEALLALPSLTVFKQEAPSPENQATNSNLNHVSQRSTSQNPSNGGVCGAPGNEADSNNNNNNNSNNNNNNNNNNTSLNNEQQRGCGRTGSGGSGAVGNLISSINGGNATTITTNGNSPSRSSIVTAAVTTVNQPNHRNNNHGSRNNGQTGGGNLHQLLYSNNDDYPVNSSSGNPHVSSSQQGNEFNEDSRFQYVLAAATSIATKLNEETLTYLNQGQSYEIKLKKLGDLSAYRGKILKSSIRICFHERRLQYTEREQMLAWQRARPGERLLEVDVPLSYGMLDVSQLSASKNSIEFMWDPTKEVGVYIKVNCISTEFTPKKHGGEKGVPFRVLVETRLPGGPRLHAASCQVKVFKLKGADRKHKQDRDKILRRPPHEQDKYQPSYDCTVLSDIPLDSLSPPSPINQSEGNLFRSTDPISSREGRTDVVVVGGGVDEDNVDGGTSSAVVQTTLPLSLGGSPVVPFINTLERSNERDERCGNTESSNSVNVCTTSSTATSTIASASLVPRLLGPVARSTLSSVTAIPDGSDVNEAEGGVFELAADANVAQTNAWLRARRFHPFQATFASFSAGDILRLSRDDLIQICGLADGIRLFNALHSKAPTPKLTLYFAMEGNSAVPWRVIYLENLNSNLFASKLIATLNLPHDRLQSVLIQGPQGVHVLVSNELVANIKDESMYLVEILEDCSSDRYKLLLKPSPSPSPPSQPPPPPPPPR